MFSVTTTLFSYYSSVVELAIKLLLITQFHNNMLVYNSSLIRKILLAGDDNKQGNPQLNRIKRIRDFEMLILTGRSILHLFPPVQRFMWKREEDSKNERWLGRCTQECSGSLTGCRNWWPTKSQLGGRKGTNITSDVYWERESMFPSVKWHWVY